MSIPGTIGKNIKDLMKEKRISIRQLAEVINVTHPTMSSYIKGAKIIDSEKLMVIARYFNKRFEYFFEHEHSTLPILFRADRPGENSVDESYEYIRGRIMAYADIVEDGLNYIPPCYSLEPRDKDSNEVDEAIERIAYEQRRLLNIENHIPENYFPVLSGVGFHVLCYDLHNPRLFGASSYIEGKGSYIFVNSNGMIPVERQIFSLIHELGHLIFHRNEYQDPEYNPYYRATRGDAREKTADSFAGYFLLPRYMVGEYISRNGGGNAVSMIDMKRHFKVSIQTLAIALKKYGYINDDKYKSFWRSLNKAGNMKAEPEPLAFPGFEKVNEKLVKNLRELYLKDEISVNKIAEVLDQDVLKARQIAKDWSSKDVGFDITL
ncbi:MAG: XRE family transcriptional regulator [Clostridia bacterium]